SLNLPSSRKVYPRVQANSSSIAKRGDFVKDKAYQQELDFLYSLQKYGIKFGLSKTRNLLQDLGNPHQGRKYIHIAGTNGKGSVAAFLAGILQQAGLRVGLYTSPHLVRFTERFQINSREIDRQDVVELSKRLRRVMNSDEPPTFFEAVTAMGLAYFAEANTDLDIIETGMGGRLDATNLIRPQVAIITNISPEHQDFLGKTLEPIAREKAGIIKPGVPVVSGARQQKVREIFKEVAREKKAPLYQAGRDFGYRSSGSGMHYFGFARRLNRLKLGLSGPHQARNAALALTGIELLADHGLDIDENAIRAGLEKAKWPGRMHLMQGPPRILLDGAHNTAAVRALADSLRKDFVYNRLLVVIGVMADKDAGKILDQLLPLADRVLYTRPVYERAMEPEDLQQRGKKWQTPGELLRPLSLALERAKQWAGEDDLILVTGSLFTVGEALSCLDPVGFAQE
ncbi:MAG: bifunctional folylpolyglutamate synthase/dihydrofolate synthase, partial [Desulfohalobiaceae bacterium]|nr:bifunctional folylpolyglutamate synthase/dihydrofolate synthase [Desulfohalobiaceae bacterium]